MKRLILFLAALLVVSCVMAQKIKEADVPPNVLKTFKMKMTDSVAVTWTKFDNFYTARFSKNNLKASMVLSESAEWHWTRWEIPTQYLPKKVREYVAANYAGFKTAGTLIEYKPGGEFYLVSLKKKKENPVLRFTIKTEFVGTEPPRTEEKKK